MEDKPLWWKDEHQERFEGLEILGVERTEHERGPDDVVQLSDGSKVLLKQVLMIEDETGKSTKPLRVFHGHKRLRITECMEPTHYGPMKHVMFGWQSAHTVTSEDIRMIRNAFFPPDVYVMHVVDPIGPEGDLREAVTLMEMPKAWGNGVFANSILEEPIGK